MSESTTEQADSRRFRLSVRGIADEPDHDEDESIALARFLRPIDPDPNKALADAYRAEKQKSKRANT